MKYVDRLNVKYEGKRRVKGDWGFGAERLEGKKLLLLREVR